MTVAERRGGTVLFPQLPVVDVVVPEADAAAVPGLRSVVVAFCSLLDLDEDRVADVGLCVSEAVSNVVLHAYAAAAGPLRLTADFEQDALEVVVRDLGTGIRPAAPSPGLGLGLGIIARLCSRFEVEQPADGGTSVWMRFEAPSPTW